MTYLSKFFLIGILSLNISHLVPAAEDIHNDAQEERLRKRRILKAVQEEKIKQKSLEIEASQREEKKKQSQKSLGQKAKRGHAFSKKQNYR